ncbi:DUF2461 domain-containing protein [Parasphingopyxis sp.]|uniref:DUF2461 domain-containing protein n=1 Tax=Parasphingopyxis sp. TaxID=1920299 RepID=UPI0026360B5D|nr:DUF2461 domain-containing protein [Parasphingopyxis sp.]
MIPKSLFDFLRELTDNNNRDWFNANKDHYKAEVVAPISAFIERMAPRVHAISEHIVVDPRPNGGSMFRIYRDTRFSKDKTPYKTHVGCQFRHAAGKDAHAPGFYVHFEPGKCFFGGGVWQPPSEPLRAIRQRIVDKPGEWRDAVAGIDVRGNQLKRGPKGFDPEHELIEDLKRKSFFAMHEGTETLARSKKLEDEVEAQFRRAAPLMRFIADSIGVAF